MNHNIAELIVDSIIDDILGRKGLGNAWEEIDDDTRDEIREEWYQIADDMLSDAS